MKKMAESEKSKMAPNESERLLHTPIQSGNVKWFSLQHKLSNSQTKEIMYNRAWQRNPIREKSNWCDGKISLVFAKNVHLAGWLNLTCTYRILMICRRRLGWTCPSVRWVSRAYFPFSVHLTSSCQLILILQLGFFGLHYYLSWATILIGTDMESSVQSLFFGMQLVNYLTAKLVLVSNLNERFWGMITPFPLQFLLLTLNWFPHLSWLTLFWLPLIWFKIIGDSELLLLLLISLCNKTFNMNPRFTIFNISLITC